MELSLAFAMSFPCDAQVPDFAIYLDYGTDCCFGNHSDLTVSERGIVLRSRWHFTLGTQLAMRICAHAVSPDDCPVCEDLIGTVVSCERIAERHPCFKVTILFLDVTVPAQRGLGRVADRLDLAGQLN